MQTIGHELDTRNAVSFTRLRSWQAQLGLWLVVFVSALVAGYVARAGYVQYYGEDAGTYLRYALALSQGSFDPSLSWRTAGYPAALILTGFTVTGSLAGILALQAAAGAAMPVLAQLPLRPCNNLIAGLVGAVLMLSLVPYVYITTIYPDTLFTLCLVAATVLLCAWLRHDARPLLAAAIVVCFALSWLRPVGVVLALAIFAIAAVRRRRDLPFLAVCAAAFFGLLFGLSAWERSGAQTAQGHVGRQVFFNAYMWSDGASEPFSGGDGARQLRANLQQFFASGPAKQYISQLGPAVAEATYEQLFGRFAGHPDAQVEEIFRRPHLHYYWIISSLTHIAWGPQGDSQLLRASLRHYWDNPLQLARSLFLTYTGLVIGPSWRFGLNGYNTAGIARDYPLFEAFEPRGGPAPINYVKNLDSFANQGDPPSSVMQWARNYFAAVYPPMVVISYGLMLLGVIGWLTTRGYARSAALTVFLLHTANVLALAFFVDPQFRYQTQSVPLAFIGAGFGLCWIWQTAISAGRYRLSADSA